MHWCCLSHRVVSGAPLAPVDHPDEHSLVPGQYVQRAPRVPLVRSEQLTLCGSSDVTWQASLPPQRMCCRDPISEYSGSWWLRILMQSTSCHRSPRPCPYPHRLGFQACSQSPHRGSSPASRHNSLSSQTPFSDKSCSQNPSLWSRKSSSLNLNRGMKFNTLHAVHCGLTQKAHLWGTSQMRYSFPSYEGS